MRTRRNFRIADAADGRLQFYRWARGLIRTISCDNAALFKGWRDPIWDTYRPADPLSHVSYVF